MENYKKGKNVEEPLERDKIPIKNLPQNFLWMHVKPGSKIRNLLTHALSELPETKSVVWTGYGPSVGKAITCAEVMKREHKNKLHQITKLCYRKVSEYWDPLLSELDQIIVTRKLPMIHIYLSIDPIDTEELGYQAPGVFISYTANVKKPLNNKRKTKEFANNRTSRKENGHPSTSNHNT